MTTFYRNWLGNFLNSDWRFIVSRTANDKMANRSRDGCTTRDLLFRFIEIKEIFYGSLTSKKNVLQLMNVARI